jgi:hypothetical protein
MTAARTIRIGNAGQGFADDRRNGDAWEWSSVPSRSCFTSFFAFYYALPCRNLVILTANLPFYAWREPRYIPSLITYTWSTRMSAFGAHGPGATRAVPTAPTLYAEDLLEFLAPLCSDRQVRARWNGA